MKQLALLVFSFLSLSLYAQQNAGADGAKPQLSGRIIDSLSGRPLPGASIYFPEARIGAIANKEGQYILRNVPHGHHLVEVSHTSYNTIVVHIDVAGTMQQNFALAPTIVESQGVTVTGVTSATSVRNAPIPLTMVRRQQMLQVPSSNIMDVLTRQPGVAQVGSGPAISKPVIRGLGYNRVVVLNDGMRQEGQQWGDEHGIEIDELSVQRAEILKGPASITYGSDALAGVIHFITNLPVTEGVVKGNVYSSYQTNNGQYGLHANIAGNQNGFNWNAYGSLKSAQDYRNKWDGRVLNSRFNEKNFGGYFGWNRAWGFSHFIVSGYNQQVGMIEGERDASGQFLMYPESSLERVATSADLKSRKVEIPYQTVRHYKAITDNSFNIGRNRLKINAGFQNNLREEFGHAEHPDETELAFDLKSTSYNVQWLFPEHNHWQATIGTSGMYQVNKNKGEEAIIPEYNLFDMGGFVLVQKFLNKLTISGGARYDNRNVNSQKLEEDNELKFAPFKRSFANFSGSAGISYRPTDYVTFKANVARGFRAPTLSELASNGAHEGTNRYEYGLQNLKSEKSFQTDLGLQADYLHVSFSLSAFYNRVSDFIFYQRLSSALGGDSIIVKDGEELEAFQYNQNNARLQGIEAVIDLHPHPLDWLHFENTFSIVRGRFDAAMDNSRNLPLMPAPRWISEVRLNFASGFKGLKNVYALVEMDRNFEQAKAFTGFGTETATAGYTLFNAGLGADVQGKKGTLFSLHLAAQNFTDVAYQNHLSRLKYTAENEATGRQGVFGMGRNFSVKLQVPFSFSRGE